MSGKIFQCTFLEGKYVCDNKDTVAIHQQSVL